MLAPVTQFFNSIIFWNAKEKDHTLNIYFYADLLFADLNKATGKEVDQVFIWLIFPDLMKS